MHTPLFSITAAVAAALWLASPATAAPKIGQPAPDFSVIDSHGKVHTLKDYQDKTVVLEWTNHECPFVVKHYEGSDNMPSLQKHYGGKEVVWLTVISSAPGKQGHVSPGEANTLAKQRNADPHAILLDESGAMGRAYDAKVTPHMYVIDQGVLAYMGGIDSIASKDVADIPKAIPHLANAADAVLGGKPVATPITRPYGCTVKY